MSGGVGHCEQHDQVFKRSVARLKCCVPVVTGGDVHISVSGTQVEFGEDGGSAQLANRITDEWKGVAIFGVMRLRLL